MSRTHTILGVLLLQAAAGLALAQNTATPPRVPYDGADTLSGPQPIHIDEKCRVLPGSGGVPTKKNHPYNDSAICNLEGKKETEHQDERVEGNQLKRWLVRIKEQTYVLQDIADQPVMYIVQFEIPKDWFIDSDPQPWQTVGQTAYFRVYVKPGETIRLHVGVRRAWPQGSKPI